MRVEGLGLQWKLHQSKSLVEDLKTQSTSGVEAFCKYSYYKESKSHHWSKASFTILYLHLLDTMLTPELHLKNPEDLSN